MKVFSSIVEWINKDTVGLYENRLQAVVLRCVSIVSIIYYLFITALFFCNDLNGLGVYDLAGIFVLSYALYLTYHKHVKLAFWIYSFAVVFMVIFQVVYVGWGIGFQYSLFLLMIILLFATYYSIYVKLGFAGGYGLIFLGLYLYSYYHNPYVVFLHNVDCYMSVVTIIYSFGCLILAAFYFGAKNSEMEKKLVEYSKTLERLAFFDPHTGLYNRRQTVKFLERKVKDIEDNDKGLLTVILGDIDYFKKVNDVYGHECGDIVLKEIASIIKKTVNKQGLTARWGGEEILIVLPETDTKKAVELVGNIVDNIRKTVVNYNEHNISITMSFGVQQFGKNVSVDELIKGADMKLYMAKEAGRDRVVAD